MENNIYLEEKFAFVSGEKVEFLDFTAASDRGNKEAKITTVNLRQLEAIASLENARESLTIAIEAQNRTIAIDALIAGADAVTFIDIEPDEMLLVTRAVARGCTIVDRRESPHFWVFPQIKFKTKTKQWQNAIAGEILNYWRGIPLTLTAESEKQLRETTEGWNLTNLVSQIKIKSGISLEEELSRVIESLSRKKIDNRQDLLVHIEVILDKWYCRTLFLEDGTPNCCLAVLKANTFRLSELVLIELERSYSSLRYSGSYTLSQWLKSLVAKLRTFEVDAELEFQIANQKIYSALNAYEKLKLNLTKEENFQAALNSLKFQYIEKIKARSSLLAGEILARLILALSTYRDRVMTSDRFLYQLQENLSNGNSPKLLDLTQIENFQLARYRDRLMMKIGKPFNEWGNLSLDKQLLLKEEVKKRSLTIAWELIVSQYSFEN